MPVEPVIFAVLLMALTLGINVALPKMEAGAAADSAQQAHPAPPVQVAHSAEAN